MSPRFSLFGYDPLQVYTGRAPLETAAMGIHLGPNDYAIRCNLVFVPMAGCGISPPATFPAKKALC